MIRMPLRMTPNLEVFSGSAVREAVALAVSQQPFVVLDVHTADGKQ